MAESKSSSLVAVVMGSTSDWDVMSGCVKTLDELGIANEAHVLSAHRTPDATVKFARDAASRGIRVMIAAAGGAAHLAGVIAAYTWLPVLGVPMQSQALQGLDSLLSMAQMPGGIPVGTLAIGGAGAKNAALLAASILALSDDGIRKNLEAFRKKQTDAVLSAKLPK
ncbi:MAG: 5-(carboxyamino)imidazole ribonucleotide mutase [Verrucomicrobiota bacterium]